MNYDLFQQCAVATKANLFRYFGKISASLYFPWVARAVCNVYPNRQPHGESQSPVFPFFSSWLEAPFKLGTSSEREGGMHACVRLCGGFQELHVQSFGSSNGSAKLSHHDTDCESWRLLFHVSKLGSRCKSYKRSKWRFSILLKWLFRPSQLC